MKTYKLIIEDKSGNDLTSYVITANNKKEAKEQGKACMANTKLNDAAKFRIV